MLERDELVKKKGNIEISNDIQIEIDKFDITKIIDILVDLHLRKLKENA